MSSRLQLGEIPKVVDAKSLWELAIAILIITNGYADRSAAIKSGEPWSSGQDVVISSTISSAVSLLAIFPM